MVRDAILKYAYSTLLNIFDTMHSVEYDGGVLNLL